jgi:LysR family nitrogen assimilation transcriptional regulator
VIFQIWSKLSLKVVEADSAMLAGDISRGLVDIALLVGIVPDDKVFHYQIIREPMLLVVPAASDLAGRKSIAFRDLRELSLILPSTRAGIRTQLEKMSLGAGTELIVAFEIDSTELTKDAVRNGLGYGILPPVALMADAPGNALVGIPIVEPDVAQVTNWAVRSRWQVPRSTYGMVEMAVFEEWQAAVSDGDWPADWLFDVTQRGMAPPRQSPLGSR